jgi:hypothetical protein
MSVFFSQQVGYDHQFGTCLQKKKKEDFSVYLAIKGAV